MQTETTQLNKPYEIVQTIWYNATGIGSEFMKTDEDAASEYVIKDSGTITKNGKEGIQISFINTCWINLP